MTAVERLDKVEALAHSAIWILPMDADTLPELDQLVMHDVRTLIAALRAVLALHNPVSSDSYNGYECAECGAYLTAAHPDCPTIAALTAALDLS